MGEVVKLWDWARERWPYKGIVRAFDERCEKKEQGMIEDESIEIPEGMGEVTPIRKVQPGDILDVVIKLRKLMSMYETCSYTLYADFGELGDPMLEQEADKARHTLELATARVASLLASIEKTPCFVELRRETLARRKERANPARAAER